MICTRAAQIGFIAAMYVVQAAPCNSQETKPAPAKPAASTADGTEVGEEETTDKFVRIDKPTTYKSLIADGNTILQLVNRGTLTFDCDRGDVIRDVEIRNKTNKPQTIVLKGSNVRVDNLVLEGCTLHLDGLQNSTLTSLCIVNSLSHGMVIDNATCNCEINGTFKRNAGFGVMIDSAETRSIEIYGKPIEENKLGQVCVNAIDRYGSISLKGRLNSIPENGSPLTIKATEGRIHFAEFS